MSLLVRTVVVSAFLVVAAGADLVNGSFEQWQDRQPVGWQVPASDMVSQDRQQPLAGESCLLITLGAGRNSVELVQATPTAADSARLYQLLFSFRQEPNVAFLVDMRYFGADGTPRDMPLFHWRQPVPAWTERIIRIVPPSSASAMAVRLYAVGAGRAWVDGMTFADAGPKIAVATASPRELLHNPGFEDYAEDERFGAVLSDGVWRPNAPIKVTIVRNSAEAHSGQVCLFAEQESEGQGAFYQSGLPVDFQKRFEVTFWAKGDGDLRILVYQFPWPTVSVGAKIDLTPEWREYRVSYLPTSSLVNRAALAFHFAGELWLDDVSFREGP